MASRTKAGLKLVSFQPQSIHIEHYEHSREVILSGLPFLYSEPVFKLSFSTTMRADSKDSGSVKEESFVGLSVGGLQHRKRISYDFSFLGDVLPVVVSSFPAPR